MLKWYYSSEISTPGNLALLKRKTEVLNSESVFKVLMV